MSSEAARRLGEMTVEEFKARLGRQRCIVKIRHRREKTRADHSFRVLEELARMMQPKERA